MAKIHTHYDNLKVSRNAPPEVIRAAYKALSQKYHPDKNPNDEKAARIMAVVNTAYNTLSNEQTRKEHDEWIAAEEWEIAWLESTRQEEGKEKGEDAGHGWDADARPDRRRGLAPRLLAAIGCIALGWLAATAVQMRAQWLPPVYGLLGLKNPPAAAAPVAAPQPATRVVAVSQIRLPDFVCETDYAALPAPGDGTWPAQSGYLPGTRLGNQGGDTQIVVDNGENAASVKVQLYDAVRNENARELFVRAHEKFTIQKLAAGTYELRFQAAEMSPQDKADCEARRRARAQAAAPAVPATPAP